MSSFKPFKILATVEIEYELTAPANVGDIEEYSKKKVKEFFTKDLITLQKYNTDLSKFIKNKVARIRIEDQIDDNK